MSHSGRHTLPSSQVLNAGDRTSPSCTTMRFSGQLWFEDVLNVSPSQRILLVNLCWPVILAFVHWVHLNCSVDSRRIWSLPVELSIHARPKVKISRPWCHIGKSLDFTLSLSGVSITE